jgi:hypothetical protein
MGGGGRVGGWVAQFRSPVYTHTLVYTSLHTHQYWERVREVPPPSNSSFMVSLVDGTYPTSLLQTVQQFREREPKLTLFCFVFVLFFSLVTRTFITWLWPTTSPGAAPLSITPQFCPPPFRFCFKKPLGNYLRSRALTVPGSGRRRWLTLRLYPSLFFFYLGVFGSNRIQLILNDNLRRQKFEFPWTTIFECLRSVLYPSGKLSN